MDLPPDKMKTLREFPSDKKWDIIRDKVGKQNSYLVKFLFPFYFFCNVGSSYCKTSTRILY